MLQAWEELGPKWPEAFWDDWLREPPQRKGRQFLRPEISRSYTFGENVRAVSWFVVVPSRYYHGLCY